MVSQYLRILTGCVFLVLVAACGWGDKTASPSDEFTDESRIGISGATLQEYDEDGTLMFQAVASSITQTQNSDRIDFENIEIDVALEDGTRWALEAPSGVIEMKESEDWKDGQRQVRLAGAVTATSFEHEEQVFQLQGRDLLYNPESQSLSSQSPVTIATNSATFSAGRFEFDLETQELHLSATDTNRVQIVYSATNP